ncbi:hypothetical protein AGR7A_Cc10050 [Agrobacterium deltaense NCPPB 1641]|uniref:Uncharacterized protein n=1 Tax=Agrobacterium deltaense NCPPB 1641 TaxID=1183425 RepID=A0A1S7TID2_9HYPH|nr:hypothetical protein AGR7A_Cc10050 [Agrobacterium deltaense NCPPB 1641]
MPRSQRKTSISTQRNNPPKGSVSGNEARHATTQAGALLAQAIPFISYRKIIENGYQDRNHRGGTDGGRPCKDRGGRSAGRNAPGRVRHGR